MFGYQGERKVNFIEIKILWHSNCKFCSSLSRVNFPHPSPLETPLPLPPPPFLLSPTLSTGGAQSGQCASFFVSDKHILQLLTHVLCCRWKQQCLQWQAMIATSFFCRQWNGTCASRTPGPVELPAERWCQNHLLISSKGNMLLVHRIISKIA